MSRTGIHTNSAEESFDDWDVESPMPVLFSESDPRYRAPVPITSPGSPSSAAPPRLITTKPQPTLQPIPMQGKLGHFPAFMTRSGLFGVARTAPLSLPLPMSEVMVQGKYELEYEGPRLNMTDKAVWQAVVDMAKESALNFNEPLHSHFRKIPCV